jgi:p-aminobenzoyl-glutamate transporter AbgT
MGFITPDTPSEREATTADPIDFSLSHAIMLVFFYMGLVYGSGA